MRFRPEAGPGGGAAATTRGPGTPLAERLAEWERGEGCLRFHATSD